MTPLAQQVPQRAFPPQGAIRSEPKEPSIGDLFGQLAAETGMLVRQEVKLATSEATQILVASSKHALVVSIGAVLGVIGTMTLTGALVAGLATVMALWLSALFVGLALAVIAYALVKNGTAALRRMSLKPARTLASLKANKSWAQALVR